MAAADEAATVFLETSLGTHLAVSFPASATTVQDLMRRVSDEHAASFPRIGHITVESFKVRRRGYWYNLTDSMAVRAAFHGIKGAWHLQAHVLPHPAAAHEATGCGTSNNVLCAHQNAIGVPLLLPRCTAPAASLGAISDAPSTDQEDGHNHPDPGAASALAPHDAGGTSVDKCNNVEGTVRGENSDPDVGSEDGDGPARGQRQGGVIEEPRGRKQFREEDGDHDQSVLAGGTSVDKCHNTARGENSEPDVVSQDGDGPARGQPQAGVIEEPRGRKHFREEDYAGYLAPLVCSIRQDDKNRCTHSSVPKRICATAREDELLDGVGANSIGVSEDIIVLSSDDEMLEDDEEMDFLEMEKEEAVSTGTLDQAETPVEELCDPEAVSITNDEGSKLCFLVNKNDLATDAGKHADEGMAQEKQVEQQDHLDDGEELNAENPAPCPVNKNVSTTALEKRADGGMPQEKLVEQQDHLDNGEESNSEIPALCFSVNKSDSTTAKEEHADGGMAHEKLVEQQDHLDNCTEVLQNSNSKDSSLIHPKYVSDCDQYDGSSRSFDLKRWKNSGCEILADKVGDHNCVCLEVERAASEKRDRSIKIGGSVSATVGGCFHIFTPTPDLDFSEKRVNSTDQHYHRSDSVLEPSIAEMCNSANSKKRTNVPPCTETLKEGNSSEKEAMAHDVKGKGPWTPRVCNDERSSKKETDLPPCVEALKEVYSEKEHMAHKVEEKVPARVSNSGSSSNGTDHSPCVGSMKEDNSSEKEGVIPIEEKQSTRTVTLVDVDGTKWEVELDDSFEIVPQESSSSSDAEESYSHLAKPPQNGTPENGGTRAPIERTNLLRHGSFTTPTSNDPTESKGGEGTSADGAKQGAWDGRRRPRHVVRKMPNSKAAKMYGYR